MTDGFIFLDSETTGKFLDGYPLGDPRQPKPVQIAYALFSPLGEELYATSAIIRPEEGWPPLTVEAFSKHGVSDEMRAKGVSVRRVLHDLDGLAGGRGAVCGGHNVGYDIGVIQSTRVSLNCPAEGPADRLAWVDTMLIGEAHCRIPGKDPSMPGFKFPSLEELHRHLFGDAPRDAHDALGDTRDAARCYFELRRLGCPDRPPRAVRTVGGRDPAEMLVLLRRAEAAPKRGPKEVDLVAGYLGQLGSGPETIYVSEAALKWVSDIAMRIPPLQAAASETGPLPAYDEVEPANGVQQ
jgi:DNA polymerase III epsilon subunit-like protein